MQKNMLNKQIRIWKMRGMSMRRIGSNSRVTKWAWRIIRLTNPKVLQV